MSLASVASLGFFNPVHAVVTKVAEIGIVGFDKRAFTNSISNRIDAVQQRLMPLVMQADVPNAPRSKVVGDMGFDPLNIGTSDNFAYMREAEIKHGRLAMLAAVAWPLQEIVHPFVVDVLRSTGIPATDVLVESGGASPSLLNGGLFQNEVLPAVLLFTIGASVLEENDLNERKAMGLGWNEYAQSFSGGFGKTPGNFGFDPLNLYRPMSAADKVVQQERELANGRVAMLAVGSYVATEYFFDTTIVQATPAIFEPLIFQPWFRAFMDNSFGMASMDGSIDGVAF